MTATNVDLPGEDLTIAGATGTKVGDVEIAIDYAIIQHFSDHLYGSPNKAVEELVTNGYDALATVAHVFVPGPEVADRVIIWDDGESMDAAALKQLWWIAKSPKAGTERIATSARVTERKVIGKFGIGKLASYSVGNRITHLCKTGDVFLLVNVDYRELGVEELEGDGPESNETALEPASGTLPSSAQADQEASESDEPHQSPIVRLTEQDARSWVEAQFRRDETVSVIDDMWTRPSWTLAVIDELKDVALPPGRLGWVLSTGMPLRDDFAVFVNGAPVESKLAKGLEKQWDLSDPALATGVKAAWSEARDASKVVGDILHETGSSEDESALSTTMTLPTLGEVQATVRFFKESLNKGKAAEHGRSYGFFIYVRGRLLNPDDPFVLLSDPSFGTFYRGQWIIHADQLDAELLADRERLRRSTTMSRELELLQQALYLAARSEFDRQDQVRQHERSSASLLPVDSRESFREPLTALLLSSGMDDPGFDLAAPVVERKARGVDEPIAVLDADAGGFTVNASHPLIDAIRERLGGGKKAKEALRVVDLFAVAERLLEGHLYDIGTEDSRVASVLEWRDELFRAMAGRYRGAPDEVIAKVEETSYTGKGPFENALADLFRLMGFVATRDGAPGQKDVLVVAPIGAEEQRFTIEGKGSGGPVANDDAEISIAASHREKVGASHAIVVAREFTGFKQTGSEPEILRQCAAVKNVSVVTIDVLADLYEAVHRYFYPLDIILPVLAANESPADKKLRVAALTNPVEGFDHRRLLELAWEEQQNDAARDVVVFRSLWQRHYKEDMTFDDFRVKLQALEALSRGLIRLQGDDRSQGTLRQSPELIANAIAASLSAAEDLPDTAP